MALQIHLRTLMLTKIIPVIGPGVIQVVKERPIMLPGRSRLILGVRLGDSATSIDPTIVHNVQTLIMITFNVNSKGKIVVRIHPSSIVRIARAVTNIKQELKVSTE